MSKLRKGCLAILMISMTLPLTGWRPLIGKLASLPDLSLLQEGDIVLTFSGAPSSWLLALSGSRNPDRLKQPYGHGEMVFRGGNGELMMGGVFGGRVDAAPVKERLPLLNYIAVLRAKGPPQQRQLAAKELAEWVDDPRMEKMEFDYTFQDVPGRKDKFFCLGIINEAYRTAGLKVPFPYSPWEPNGVAQHVQAILDAKIERAPNLESIFDDPDFHLVLKWRNDSFDHLDMWLTEHIVRKLMAYYEQGWRLRTMTGTHLLLALRDLPGQVEDLLRTQTQLSMFHDRVTRTWKRLRRRGMIKADDSDSHKREVLDVVCDKYRDDYFVKNGG